MFDKLVFIWKNSECWGGNPYPVMNAYHSDILTALTTVKYYLRLVTPGHDGIKSDPNIYFMERFFKGKKFFNFKGLDFFLIFKNAEKAEHCRRHVWQIHGSFKSNFKLTFYKYYFSNIFNYF